MKCMHTYIHAYIHTKVGAESYFADRIQGVSVEQRLHLGMRHCMVWYGIVWYCMVLYGIIAILALCLRSYSDVEL